MNVYIDCGAHTGRTAENWSVTHPDCDRIYAFEPNPACMTNARWAHMRAHMHGLRVYQEAVWVADCALPLYRCSQQLSNQSATVLEGKTTGDLSYQAPVSVPALDFAAWLPKHVTPADHVTVKMDIEGAEYAVLGRCLDTGALDLINDLVVEFHADKFEGDALVAAHGTLMRRLAGAGLRIEEAVEFGGSRGRFTRMRRVA